MTPRRLLKIYFEMYVAAEGLATLFTPGEMILFNDNVILEYHAERARLAEMRCSGITMPPCEQIPAGFCYLVEGAGWGAFMAFNIHV